jgi:hypothetical protein
MLNHIYYGDPNMPGPHRKMLTQEESAFGERNEDLLCGFIFSTASRFSFYVFFWWDCTFTLKLDMRGEGGMLRRRRRRRRSLLPAVTGEASTTRFLGFL